MTEAVPSGRNVREESSRSMKVYISFSTMSVASPIARANNSVFSMTGRIISENPYAEKTVCTSEMTVCHKADSSGKMSRKPLTAAIVIGASWKRGLCKRGAQQSMWTQTEMREETEIGKWNRELPPPFYRCLNSLPEGERLQQGASYLAEGGFP